jgi:hypothetical protein
MHSGLFDVDAFLGIIDEGRWRWRLLDIDTIVLKVRSDQIKSGHHQQLRFRVIG